MFAYNHGRFTSPDPYDINLERQYSRSRRKGEEKFGRYITQPQHWNHYAYTLNNPLRYTDPTGLLEYETTLLGQKIKVNISDSISKDEQEIIKKKIDGAITLINDNASNITKEQQAIIRNITGINVVENGENNVSRSGIDLETGVFTITKMPDIIYSSDDKNYPSSEWVAGIIIHDSFHPDQYKRGLKFDTGEEGGNREREANAFTATITKAMGFDNSITAQFVELSINPGDRYKEPFEKSQLPTNPRRVCMECRHNKIADWEDW
jgi:hypothetical protein